MGITSNPTSRSATARDIRKKLVAFWSFLSSDTARMTRMFPPMVGKMTRRMSSAAQQSSPFTTLTLAILLCKIELLFFPWARPALSQTPSDQRVMVCSIQMMHFCLLAKIQCIEQKRFQSISLKIIISSWNQSLE